MERTRASASCTITPSACVGGTVFMALGFGRGRERREVSSPARGHTPGYVGGR